MLSPELVSKDRADLRLEARRSDEIGEENRYGLDRSDGVPSQVASPQAVASLNRRL